jgi:hypothetical protein
VSTLTVVWASSILIYIHSPTELTQKTKEAEMAGILIQLNQATTRLMSWANLKVRHLGWADADNGIWFKRDDGTTGGDPHLIPSTIGQGMGRRVTQNAHGFVEKWLVYHNGTSWVSASAAALESLATHMVVRVINVNTFEVAQVGAWAFSGIVPGPIYLSASVPGTTASTPEGLGQKVATGIGDSYHLLMGGSPAGPPVAALDDLTDVDTAGEVEGDLLMRGASDQWVPAHVTVSESAPTGAPAAGDLFWFVVEPL